MLQLYHHDISVCAQKVRLVLAEKRVPWEGVRLDLAAGDQTRAEYLALNPHGVVPTLVHDGRVVIESTIICEYLDDAFPEPALRPAAPHDRAAMRGWARIPDDGLHVACGSLSFAAVFARQLADGLSPDALADRLDSMPNRARAARQREIIERGFEAPLVRDAVFRHERLLADMEKRLGANPWLASDAFSLAEACLLPYVERLARLGLAPMWASRPGVADWYDRLRGRESYRTAITDWPPTDGYDDRLAERGESAWPEVARVLASA